ncbi:MAG: peptidoglycan-binding domain-containing protein [bacterium]
MNRVTKSVLGAAVGFSMLVPVAAFASGLTSSQVNAIVSLLQSFNASTDVVSNVQAVLNGQAPAHNQKDGSGEGVGSTTTMRMMPAGQIGLPMGQAGKMACIALTRNLGLGAKGDDVKQLQEMLAEDPENGFAASSTGTFGPMTMRAMKRFQEKNDVASTTTGLVGPATRDFFERRCGKGLDGQQGKPEGQDRPILRPMGSSTMPMMGRPGEAGDNEHPMMPPPHPTAGAGSTTHQ